MKTAIILHGYNDEAEYRDESRPAASNDHWIPWVQRQLLLKGIEAQTPEMPGFYKPDYQAWKQTFERFTPDADTILIGHSCGGGFLVRWLSERKDIRVGKVVLVAPWLDPENHLGNDFFKFEIDPELASRTVGLTVMYSTDDYKDILASIETLRAKLRGTEFEEFADKGHFVLGSMKTEKFPELIDVLKL